MGELPASITSAGPGVMDVFFSRIAREQRVLEMARFPGVPNTNSYFPKQNDF